MFIHTFSRTVLGALFAAILLVPAAHADDWARNQGVAINPAIAAAIHDRASLQPEPVRLDAAIQAALLERTYSATRPDDRPGTRGVGALPKSPQAATSNSFDLNSVSIGVGAALALLLGFGLLMAVRHQPTRATGA